MISFDGYKTLEKISESQISVIYSAVREFDKMQVILKFLRSDHPTAEQIALLFHEHAMTKELKLPGVIRVYDLVEKDSRYALVKENMNGVTLTTFLKNGPITDLILFFKLALQMVRILGELHQEHIIHKDIKPDNFIINPQTFEIKLTDLNYSTFLEHELQSIEPPEKIEGTLAYMAPEQTGRMNRKIDYRSDFYSLGVSFYEMLTGQLPFNFSDPLELLHAHLTNLSPKVSDINPDVPEMVSVLIGKLMEKIPKNRYQSSIGLEADLKKCQTEWLTNKKIETFVLGQNDLHDRLNLSQKLYGRETEARKLLKTFQKVGDGNVEALMVCGYSGIGKTMLIDEVHKPMVKHRGYFIKGKFDQLERNTPYIAITQAFNQFARLILAESESRFAAIKAELLRSLGDIGQVLIDLAPDLELVIGKQPPLEELPQREAERRLEVVLIRFLRAAANSDHPLVIFIDDLQWVDSGSLKLLEFILTSEQLSHLLLIGAYRDNEVDSSHPLMQFFHFLKKEKKEPEIIKLGSLTKDDFSSLLNDSLETSKKKSEKLAELIHKRTEGNPFFAKQVINKLYNEKLIFFNYDKKEWGWDYEKIKSLSITDNVVDLMVNKLEQLPKNTRDILKYAACLGNRFDIAFLSVVSQKKPEEIGQSLWPALQQDLLITLQLGYKRVDALRHEQLSALLAKDITYQFIHDKVQQAVYQSIDNKENQQIHLTIARLLMEMKPEECKKELLYEVTDHFNHALNNLTIDEIIKVAGLNYFAGVRAGESNAYLPMQKYLKVGIDLSDEGWWDEHHDLIFNLHLEYINSFYLLGDRVKVGSLVDALYKRCVNTKEFLLLDRLLILDYGAQGDLIKVWEGLVRASKRMNVKLPLKPNSFNVSLSFFKLLWVLRRFDINNLKKDLPEMSDECDRILHEVLLSCNPLAFQTGPWHLAALVFVRLTHALERGFVKSLGVSLIMYAGVRVLDLKYFDKALNIGEQGKILMEDYSDKSEKGMGMITSAYGLEHWKHHIDEAIQINRKALNYGVESGNLEVVTASHAIEDSILLFASKSIGELIEAYRKSLEIYKKFKLQAYVGLNEVGVALFESLKIHGETIPYSQIEPFYQETVLTKKLMCQIGIDILLVYYYYFLEHWELSYNHFEITFENEFPNRSGTFYIVGELLAAISLSKIIPDCNHTKKRLCKKRFYWLKKRLGFYGEKSSVNYQLFSDIISGVDAKMCGDWLKAIEFFNNAIAKAKSGGFTLWIALSNELAGELLAELNNPRLAMSYIQEAYYFYQKFGMTPKVEILEKRYPEFFVEVGEIEVKSTDVSRVSTGTTTSAGLDFMSVIKASQTISGEIEVDKLIEHMLHIVIENAGAERTVFLEFKDKTWVVAATLERQENTENFIMINKAVDEYDDLSGSVVNLVLRSQEPIVITDARKDNRFGNDPYIQRAQPKSVMCLPIIHHGDTLGLIYLENNLVPGSFTKDRITVLKTLSSQIAISLENARHFEEIERFARSSERFVPKQFLELLERKNIEEIQLGDCASLDITVLFTDIRGFTTILESMSPDEAFSLMNRYYAVTAPLIREHHGFINLYQGDGLLALFPKSADNAVTAGLKMLTLLGEFNKEQRKLGEPELEIGVGLNSGEAMIGIIGEKERLDPTIISDIANAASRVENLNKTYGTHFLISGDTVDRLQMKDHFQMRQIDRVKVKGRQTPTDLYEVIDWEDELSEITLDEFKNLFSEAFSEYRSGDFERAIEGFKRCLSHKVSDPVATLLITRCENFLENGVPKDWDGVYTLSHK